MKPIAALAVLLAIPLAGCVLSGFQQPSPLQYAEPGAPTAATAEASPDRPEPRDSDRAGDPDLATVWLSSPKPTDHAVFRGILPGASRSDVTAAFPDLEHDVVAREGGALAMLAFQKEVVDSLDLEFRHPDVVAAAEKSWGPPTVWRSEVQGRGPEYVWFDPERKLRAVLRVVTKAGQETAQLRVESYEPARSLLGDGEGFAFERGRPLLGSTRGELEERFAGQFTTASGDRGRIALPGTEHSDSTVIKLSFDRGGEVVGYGFDISCWRNESDKEHVRQLLVDKWGEPGDLYDGNYELYREKGPRIMARYDAAGAWAVRVDR